MTEQAKPIAARKPSRYGKLIAALKKGTTLSRAQARARYGIANPSDVVYRYDVRGELPDVVRIRQTKMSKINGRKIPVTTVKYMMEIAPAPKTTGKKAK